MDDQSMCLKGLQRGCVNTLVQFVKLFA